MSCQDPNKGENPDEILQRIILDNGKYETSFNCEEEIEDFGSPIYWEKRYKESPESYDWYLDWDEIYDKIKQYFKGNELILDLGCGNSQIPEEIQKANIKTVICIDISKTVINQMIEKYKDNKNLIWLEMDCRKLNFKNESFDIVFDKGTMDSILLGSNQNENGFLEMKEVWRVLKPGGYFIQITTEKPKEREIFFNVPGMSWKKFDPVLAEGKDAAEIKKQFYYIPYYIYVLQKI